MATVSELYIYPTKSLGGIQLNEVQLTDRGFQHDRRWMLVDANNRFLTQREQANMALLQTALVSNGIEVYYKKKPAEKITIPFLFDPKEKITVTVFADRCEAVTINDEIDEWFSRYLQIPCKLVYMPDGSLRKVDSHYAKKESDITAFSDGYPVLMLSKESLTELNSRLPEALPMNRFRPNLVIEEVKAFEEDGMEHFTINEIDFYGVKLCARCVITTINQQTIEKGKEPLKTLATYRMKNNKIYFGQNVIAATAGKIKIGDTITIQKKAEHTIFNNT
jgi:uncharacterized protein